MIEVPSVTHWPEGWSVLVTNLRKKLDAPIMTTATALWEADWDIKEAELILRKAGWGVAHA